MIKLIDQSFSGWFILLTSLLGFWRVKRWERGILSSQDEAPAPSTPEERARSAAIIHSIERVFGLQGLADGSLLRQGLGFPGAMHHEIEVEEEEEEQYAKKGRYVGMVMIPWKHILDVEEEDVSLVTSLSNWVI